MNSYYPLRIDEVDSLAGRSFRQPISSKLIENGQLDELLVRLFSALGDTIPSTIRT